MKLPREWVVVVVLGVSGMALVVYGVWEQVKPREVQVQIIKSSEGESSNVEKKEIVIDIAGAVENPGLYKLPGDSRIGEALVAAGGLSASADRTWVDASLNLAEKIKDGSKIYIPNRAENAGVDLGVSGTSQVGEKVNINQASVHELDALEGIGEARAQAIVANRPYTSLEELVSRAKIPQAVYDKIKDWVTIY